MKGRIKVGACIMHDMAWGAWPACKAPGDQDFADDPDMLFDVEYREAGKTDDGIWTCTADGFGGEPYVNGSILVRGLSSVEVLDNSGIPFVSTPSERICEDMHGG